MPGFRDTLGAASAVSVDDLAVKTIDLSGAHGRRYRVTCTAATHVRIAGSGGTATVNDTLIAAGGSFDIDVGPSGDTVHAICPSGGSSVVHAAEVRA